MFNSWKIFPQSILQIFIEISAVVQDLPVDVCDTFTWLWQNWDDSGVQGQQDCTELAV